MSLLGWGWRGKDFKTTGCQTSASSRIKVIIEELMFSGLEWNTWYKPNCMGWSMQIVKSIFSPKTWGWVCMVFKNNLDAHRMVVKYVR